MKLKKFTVLLAALSMAISMTACGPKKSAEETPAPAPDTTTEQPTADKTEIKPEDGATLVIWESKDERAFTDEIAKQFTEKYKVPVKIEEVKPDEQVTKLTQDGPTGLGADVVIFPHDNLGRAASAQLLLPNDIFADETKKNNTDASVQGVTYNNELYGYPRAAETYALYYNKSLVKEAPKSFDDVIAFGKTFTDKAKKKYGIMWETGNMYFNYPFIATTGGYIYGKNGTDKSDIGINNAGAIEGLKAYQSLKEILPVKSGDITPDIKRSLFNSGDVAMDITGPWELNAYKQGLGDKLGIAPIPTIGGKAAISFSGIKAWYVNAYTKYPNASKLFAEFASSKDAQLLLNSKVGSVPTNKEALESDQIKNDPFVSAFAAQTVNSVPMPSIPEMGNVWAPVNAALPEIWDNNKDPKEAMDKAAKQIADLNNGAK
ncbi:arabinogalactan oligomer/maltooligosaccharide transport system substrate-binding protein [Paenibacillus shirakamiensis]|uniref:Maltodextrin-binding protein n=1 Tax=Paenibacillus shirakamiensis TaxID=1265935 RepID=A0ABS4JIP8_9BACL|nr:maltose ABC transporter substrate-binding protein [Paenibacillus shirakamiensis]MBP2001567.1 arabinogalactan oligomer/maltooligosaccharide transport system substrate-binding protein [Paenibacillus shirakamiensis]